MSITTTTTDDLMNSYASLINETTATTLPHNPELQLSINDLVHPTEKAETLLETLSNEQLNIIEQTLFKIKERKLGTSPSTIITGNLLSPNTVAAVQDIPSSTITTTTTTIISNDMSNITTSSESQDWDSTATRVAKALANAISMSSNNNSNNNENQQGQDPPVNKTAANIIKNSTGSSNNATMVQTHDNKNNSNNNKPQQQQAPFLSSSSHEPTTELREGVEWVSFVYSHHRTLRRYCIRTDLDKVDTSILDDKFKKENCVYPRANLPRESYRGNRWAYETECNVLGWKLAYLNMEEIAGKRGLIQRAVDSYRNRYPSMRSRRVARQEKLLKGTLRKRKHNNNNCSNNENDSKSTSPSSFKQQQQQNIQVPDHLYLERQTPKTILIEDGCSNNNSSSSKCRIRINIESVVLDAIDIAFRKNNCVFPRSMNITAETPCVTQRRLDEAKCNEIGWKLAWLNPRQLANKKNLLQRALDTYRSQFTTDLKPRKYASRVPPAPFSLTQELNPSCLKDEEDVNMEEATIQYQQLATTTTNNDSNSNNNNNNNEMTDVEMTTTDNNLKLEEGEQVVDKRLDMLQDSTTTNSKTIPLTEQALADQQREFMELDLANNNNNYTGIERRNSVAAQSCYSGTTVTLDFHDYCFSPPPEDDDDEDLDGDDEMGSFELNHNSNNNDISTTCNSPTHFTSSVMFDAVLLDSLGNDQQHIIVLQKDEDDCCHLSSSDTSHQNSPSPNNNNSASSSSSSSLSSTTEIGGGGCQVESLSMLSLNEMYQQALLLDPTSTNTLFNTTTTTTTSGQLAKEGHLFETGFGDSNELLTKYENVNAGMDDFTGPLLSQLF